MEKKQEEPDAIKLKPLYKIPPGYYLTALYGGVFALVVFLAVFFPGVTRKSAVYRFTSEPAGAAVRIDDVYRGYTPCDITVPAGKRSVSVALPGFKEAGAVVQVKARLFLRRPFIRPVKYHTELEESAPLAALIIGANDYAEWSFTGEPTAVYQVPYSLSAGTARSLGRSTARSVGRSLSAEERRRAEDILISAFRFTNTVFGLTDFIRAVCYLESNGAAPSPGSLMAAAARVAGALERDPFLSVAPASILPADMAALILDSPLYPREMIDFSDEDRAQKKHGASFGEVITVDAGGGASGMAFTAVEGGEFVQAEGFPHTVQIKPFYIALNEISAANWEVFTAACPEWRAENAASLEEQGLVTDGYLQASPVMPGNAAAAPAGGNSAAAAVAGISAAAAEAYCEWLTKRLPAGFSDYEVRLPTEAEWEYAAKAAALIGADAAALIGADAAAGGKEGAAANGVWPARLPRNMLPLSTENGPANAGLWEWCADDFAPQNYVTVNNEALHVVRSPERNIRGGCWVNQPYSVTAETRASLPPAACSPFVSARPVIAPR